MFLMTGATFTVMLAGLFLLSLSIRSHRRQLGLPDELSSAQLGWLHAIGFGCVGAAVSVWGAVSETVGFGLVIGMMAAGAGVFLLALVLAWLRK